MRGFTPSASALAALITTVAAAPSLMPLALPGVTMPSFLKAGRSLASWSGVLARGNSSVSKTRSSRRSRTVTGTICSLK